MPTTDRLSWGAVARGAVLRGLDIARTDSVLSRFHSGVRCALPYEADHDADHLQDVFEHRIYGDLYVRNAIRWYSKKVSADLFTVGMGCM